MSYKNTNMLLESLQEKGFIDMNVKQNLNLSFDEYINNLADNEVQLLYEVSIIEQKINRNESLSDLESKFWEFFLNTYQTTF